MKDYLAAGQSVVVSDLWSTPKALLAALAYQTVDAPLLIVSNLGDREGGMLLDLPYFAKRPILELPAWETLPTEEISPSADVVGERFSVLRKIAEEQKPLVVTNLQGLLQKVLPQKKLAKLQQEIKTGQSLDEKDFIETLKAFGYEEVLLTADKGEFSKRRGVVDLYPSSSPDPIRMEFWEGKVESIRRFDPLGQRSIEKLSSFLLLPATERELLDSGDEVSLLHSFQKPPVILFDDIEEMEERWVQLKSLVGLNPIHLISFEQFLDEAKDLQKIFFTDQSLERLSEVKRRGQEVTFETFGRPFTAISYHHPYEQIRDFLAVEETTTGDRLLSALLPPPAPISVTFLTESDREAKLLGEAFAALSPQIPYTFEKGYLSEGLVNSRKGELLFPYAEWTNRPKIRRQRQRSTHHSNELLLEEFDPGDLVVHLNHGIGKFLGFEKRPNHEGIETEYLILEYAQAGKLYVPLHQSHLVSRYIGVDQSAPKLSEIGSPKWRHIKEKTEREIFGYAQELLELYAKREVEGGFAFPRDDEEMNAFENAFPYIETEDQLSAVADIKKDMEDPKPMDRLVSGDVGYGKTEVAMRAAFKAIEGGKQVAVLVPTTLLALQHYENFSERMLGFPVRVAHLSRFVKTKERKEIIEAAKKGTIDVLIGTHRLIGEDIAFKDLGLVIIDEEQRFGVKAKEHLKKLRAGVDCLTLSATPIPRTLYMSLIGVRDISEIKTPPQDRLPIQSFLVEPNDILIQTALRRELNRGGQAYFIHNRVETIFDVAAHIKKLVPEARVIVGHGQLSNDEIDQIFHTFKKGDADILVSTTIVESGIDIPNANTIIIDRADTFGIADLYQLRGRVGRWNRKAFCYFFVRRIERLPELSKKRLDALVTTSGHGGGLKVALRDLELRGAGDLLGTQQSGDVSSVGFHLYCKLLKRTIQALKGDGPKSLIDCKVETSLNAKLPELYVPNVTLRLDLYRRLGDAVSINEIDAIQEELVDRFGPLPIEAEWLIALSKARVFGATRKCPLIKIEKFTLTAQKKVGKEVVDKRSLLPKAMTPASLVAAIDQLTQ